MNDLSAQATRFFILFKGSPHADLLVYADELLLFLNRLQDRLKYIRRRHAKPPAIDDIIYRLESNPDATLNDEAVRRRLLDLFVFLSPRR